MKKIMIFAAFATALSLASCQKEGLNEVVKNDPSAVSESPVFTGTINAGTKTTVDAASGKVSWETTDEITVTDKDQKTAVYSIESIDGTTGRATFVYKSGDTLGECPYTATYGTAPTTAQTYTETPGQLYMTASSETTSLTFSVQCGLMEINLTKAGESVKSIAVTGTPTGGSETTYTLTCTDAQSIAEKTSFYISVAAGSYNKIVITDSEDKVCTLTAASGITVAANHIKPLTFAGSKLDFKPNLPAGALPGVFTVSDPDGTPNSGDEKKVHFSKGNLYYDGSNWGFEEEQYYFRTYDGKSKCDANGYSTGSGTASGHWGLFGWSTEGKNFGMSTSTTISDYSGDFLDWGTAIDSKGTWSTLTGGDKGEWKYLFDHHINVLGTCNSVPGRFIAHDGFEGDADALSAAVSDWENAQKSGIVFLPAAGSRKGSDVVSVGDGGYYWSSSASGKNLAYRVLFDSSSVRPGSSGGRFFGCSVRLITESK